METVKKNDNLLVLVISLCFAFLFWGYASTDNETIKTTIITAVIAVLTIVINWRYGSSKSSANKDETIKSMQGDKTVIKSENVNAETVDTINTNTTTVGNEVRTN